MTTEKETNYLNAQTEKCPIRFTINLLGGKWKLLILWELHHQQTMRFNALKRSVSGITNTMLAKSLEELEKAGFVIRTQYNEMPLRVDYRLSDKADTLIPILESLVAWGDNELNHS